MVELIGDASAKTGERAAGTDGLGAWANTHLTAFVLGRLECGHAISLDELDSLSVRSYSSFYFPRVSVLDNHE